MDRASHFILKQSRGRGRVQFEGPPCSDSHMGLGARLCPLDQPQHDATFVWIGFSVPNRSGRKNSNVTLAIDELRLVLRTQPRSAR